MNIKKYILMNQNKAVLTFGFDEELNIITDIYEIFNIEYAPYKIKCEYIRNKNIDRVSFNHWFTGRGIPTYRDDSKEILEQFDLESTKDLINKHFALSLSDQYWIKPFSSSTQWENINYFENDYNSIEFANATFGENASSSIVGINLSSCSKFQTPNNTTDGQLKKVWIRINNKNCLLKASGSIHNFEPINEVISSKICEILDVPYVPYTLEVIHSKKQDTLVSICECAINKNEEIITAYSILSEEENLKGNEEDYNTYLAILKRHNVPNAEENLQKMFMLDFILLNEDRHLNNFGIIRDVQTLEWKSICPIFDTGRSMNTNVTTSYWNFTEGEVKCFTSNFISSNILPNFFTICLKQSQLDKLKSLVDIYQELLLKYQEFTNLSKEQIDLLVDGLGQRISYFENIMHEKNLIV